MADDWIKIRTGIHNTHQFHTLVTAIELSDEAAFLKLYQLASWFRKNGKYGKMATSYATIDRYLSQPGFCDALERVKWMRTENGHVLLQGFCDTSAIRKSLGRAIREQILSDSKCAICGTPHNLVIDHKTPISRGGTSEIENLQALCQPCNSRKGTKTMEEIS